MLIVGQKLGLKKEAKVTGRHGLQWAPESLRESRDLLAFRNLNTNGIVETTVCIVVLREQQLQAHGYIRGPLALMSVGNLPTPLAWAHVVVGVLSLGQFCTQIVLLILGQPMSYFGI